MADVVKVVVTGGVGPVGLKFETPVDQLPGRFVQMVGERRAVAVEGATLANAVAATDLAEPTGSLLAGHRNKTVGDYLALAYPPTTTVRAYGDSITGDAGGGFVGNAKDNANCFVSKLGAELGLAFARRGVPGGSIMDWMLLQYADMVTADQITTILPGFNDQRFVGTSQVFQAGYRAALGAAVAWAGIADADKVKGDDPRIQYFGAWAPTPVGSYTFGRFTQTEGSAILLPPIYGSTLLLCVLLQNNFGGTLAIEVDDVVVQTINLLANGANGISLGNGKAVSDVTYAPRLIRVTGIGPGAHKVVLRKVDPTSDAGAIHFLWADSGLRKAEKQPMVLLGDTLTMTEAGNAASPEAYRNYTRAANAQFTQIARDVAAQAAADGLDVQMVETHRAYSPDADPSNDNVHPTIAGHASIAASFARQARGVKDYGAATASREAARKVESLAFDTGEIIPVYANGWKDLDPNGFAPGRYCRDGAGWVHLSGMLSSGSVIQHSALFTLPVGFRPAKTIYFPVAVFDGAFGCVRVTAAGEVQIVTGNASWLSLNGITFRAS